ncbi:hypothetical protein SUGI_0765380 [Cryptomeria japonica]|nr:hypothetical protein SUGI_0765380 [Cryptomeria japonica]
MNEIRETRLIRGFVTAEVMSQFWKPGSQKPQTFVIDDEDGGVIPFSVHPSSASGFGYSSLEKQRQRLPVFKQRIAILYLVESHATTIIVGETGSGKTTQIPQYLKEAGWAEGGRIIACTQPRRLAVQTVASRVAEEMGVKVGAEVGYSIRFEDVTTPGVTMIKFLTDGVLLREMMEDPLLTKYSVIMIDEAHERSISTDMLLGLLKKVQRRRPGLRLVISSATIEAKLMASFFNSRVKKQYQADAEESLPSREPAIISVEGRTYDVKIHYLDEATSSYLQSSVSTVLSIHNQEPLGDILVFLTGQDDVDAAVQLITEEAQKADSSSGLFVLPLYAGLPRSEQELIFGPAPRGKRKVIVATNIAETSITLEGIVYVVDCGFSKQRFYNPITDIESLVVVPISKASAQQRAGRAGRVRSGKCYRLYTEEFYIKQMSTDGIPEMQRSNLLKALGIDNIMGFDWLASPPPEAMVRALEVLYSIGVLDEDGKLTSPTGFQVAEIPLEPMISKMLLTSSSMGCSEEILTIAAVLSVQSIWVSSKGIQKELDEAKDRFAAAEGDHVTYLNVFEGFLRSNKSSQWCHKNLINYQAIKKVIEIRNQLKKLMQRLGLAIISCGTDMEAVRKAITSGFFSHACQLELASADGKYQTVRGGQEVFIHPSSVLFRVNPKWVVYHSILSTERHYIQNVTTIESSWLLEIAPHFYQSHKSGSNR